MFFAFWYADKKILWIWLLFFIHILIPNKTGQNQNSEVNNTKPSHKKNLLVFRSFHPFKLLFSKMKPCKSSLNSKQPCHNCFLNLWGHRFSQIQTKNYKNFCPTKQTRIIALIFGDFLVIVGSFFGYYPCLFGRAEILVILGLHFGRNDDLINSFWI